MAAAHASSSLSNSIVPMSCTMLVRNLSSASTKRVLEGKVAIVTGAGGGLGQRIAERFADQGANVVVADFNEDNAKRVASSLSTPSSAFSVNVTNEDQVKECVEFANSTYGSVDILVSNAGHQFISPIQDLPYSEWQKMVCTWVLGGSIL